MNTMLTLLLVLIPCALIGGAICMAAKRGGASKKRALMVNAATCVILLAIVVGFGSTKAFAADTATTTAATDTATTEAHNQSLGIGLLAAALVTGLAGIGGGIAVAAGAPAAIAANSENPGTFGKSLIFVALGESIALYGLVISIMILNKLG
ncbi:MAG: ATP synthase subunit C [Oscillospiraceae bacterium]|nr:ATP synthase subunit C [Oscillospiraceae bacterium]